jgi:CheY-like chemotaxis protein/DNA-binding CsgD family transcriptional regulator
MIKIQHAKILVVDDDPGNIAMVSEILAHNHWIVFAANNGQTALDIAHVELPDLILLDWQMPQMDGMEILKRLKADEITRDIMVIMITGVRTHTADLLHAYETGVIDFIRKPFDRHELLARTSTVLELAESYKQQLKIKNNEMMVQTMKLAEDNQFLTNILKDIESLRSILPDDMNSGMSLINDIENKLSNKAKNSIWKEFEESFSKVNPDFNKNLLSRHPDLSPAEIKLCALLRLNLSTKEIAAIFCQSTEGVRVSRTRLRKKLTLESDDNLVKYLINI